MSLLPTKTSKPKISFEEYTTLIYGAPKTGKSTLASQFEKPLFLATEAGLNALETYNLEIDSWEKFLEACAEIVEGKWRGTIKVQSPSTRKGGKIIAKGDEKNEETIQ